MMGQDPATAPDELFELKALLEADWPATIVALRASGVPLNVDGDDDDAGDGAPPPPPAAETPKPPWGDDENFDAERAKKLIADTRADREKLKAERDELKKKVKAAEDATKSDLDKATEAATEAAQRATTAELELLRLNVAIAKGLTPAQAKRLSGSTEEELTADADELLELFKKEDGDEGGQGPSRRPKEKLRSGAATDSDDDDDETDPIKNAAKIRRAYS